MDKVESLEQAHHMGQTCKDNHEVKNLVTTSEDVKRPWVTFLRNLSSMRTLKFVIC
jgi:hypothetical protein